MFVEGFLVIMEISLVNKIMNDRLQTRDYDGQERQQSEVRGRLQHYDHDFDDAGTRRLANNPELETNYQTVNEIHQGKTISKSPIQQLFSNNNFTIIHKSSTQTPSSSPLLNPSYIHTLKNLNRLHHNPSNTKILLKTEYPIIHNLIYKYFKYKFYNKEDYYNDVFLIWMDSYVTEEFVKRLKSFQKINHFPSSCELGRKDLLSININLARESMKEQYNFYPKTWVLPKEYDSFCMREKNDRFLIVKPHANCQGRGIYLSRNPVLSVKDQVVVQEYINNPMLIDGNKFDLRIYVLLRSLDPLRIYVYKQGLCRLATQKYCQPDDENCKNQMMHLTNYAINKVAPNFIKNTDIKEQNQGHKRSYSWAIKYFTTLGFDANKIEARIESIVIRTILAGYSKMLQSYKKTREDVYLAAKECGKMNGSVLNAGVYEESVCFQVLGFDIMMLETGEPILLEVNHQPSFMTDAPIDMAVKKCLLMDTINLLCLDEKDKVTWQKNQQEGKIFRYRNVEERQLQQMGGYKRIYPLDHIKIHDKSEQQIERLEDTKKYYEAMLNKIMFREFKRLNKVKFGNYKTINTRQSQRETQSKSIQADYQRKNNSESSQKSKKGHRSTSKHKALPLTFYNMFNNSKFHVQGNPPLQTQPQFKQSKSQREQPLVNYDFLIRNHLVFSDIEETYTQKRKPLKDRVIASRESRGKTSSKEESKKTVNSFRQSNKNQVELQMEMDSPKLDSYEKYRLKMIMKKRNHGFFHYMASQNPSFLKVDQRSQKQYSSPVINKESSVSNNISEGSQSSQNQYVSDRESLKVGNVVKNVIKNVHTCSLQKDQKLQKCKQVYVNTIRQKIQKINNMKMLKNQLTKFNFTNILQKSKSNKFRLYNLAGDLRIQNKIQQQPNSSKLTLNH